MVVFLLKGFVPELGRNLKALRCVNYRLTEIEAYATKKGTFQSQHAFYYADNKFHGER